MTVAELYTNNVHIFLYLEPTAMKLVIDKDNPDAYKLSGTSVEKEHSELRNILSANMKISYQISDSANEIFKQIDLHNDDPIWVDRLMKKVDQFRAENINNAKQIDSIQMDFIKKHNTYQIVPHLVYLLARDNDIISIDTVAAIYNGLPEQSKTTLLGKLALEQIKQAERALNKKNIFVGDIAPDFIRVSMQGDTIRLTDYRGKSCILLDFWASWCGPCIKSIPDIKNIHKKYKGNLKIIGISLDKDIKVWQKMVKDHQIGMWSQILSSYNPDNNYFGNEKDLSEIYHVNFIPSYFLIDKQGKVIYIGHSIGKEEFSEIDKILK